jgi:ribosomal protein S18 acetylase RimI-like enzyme
MYIKNFKLFESNSIYAKSYTLEEFREILYDKDTYLLKDPTLQSRIRYMDIGMDLSAYNDTNNFHFIVLYEKEKIIGVCKIGHYSLNEFGDDQKYMSISYCSIDKDYRNKGYLKIMIEELMKLCKKRGFYLGASSWTVPGNVKLRPTIKKYAKKYGVKFIDHNNKHDTEYYYKDFTHISEMTPIEYDEWNKEKKRDRFEGSTGRFNIYVLDINTDSKKIEDIYDKIENGKYDYKKDFLEGYYYDHGTVYLKTGTNVIVAALKYWKNTGNYKPVEKIIRNAKLEYRDMKHKIKMLDSLLEDVHYDKHEKPKWFYVVLRDRDKTFENLSKMELKKLKGISDTRNVTEAWLDVRNILLAMPADKVIELNNIHPVYYFKPDQLVSKNFKILKRLWSNENGDDKYNIKSVVTKICQNASLIGGYKKDKGVIGNRKKAKIFGTWTTEARKKYIADIIYYINQSDFYYKFSNYVADKVVNENYTINNMNSFIKLLETFLKDEEEYLRKDRGSWMPKIDKLIDLYNKYGFELFKKIFTWCIIVSTKYYSKSESEWIVKSEKFKIPKGSHLFLKYVPDDFYDNNEIRFKWIEKMRKDEKDIMGRNKKYKNESYGKELNELKKIVSEYNLQNKYYINLRQNRFEVHRDLKRILNQ